MVEFIFILKESFGGRKTFPESPNNRGVVRNKPDVPSVQMEEIRNLGVFIPNGSGSTTPNGLVEDKPAISEEGYVPIKGTQRVPLRRQPLTPLFQTHHGGGRTGGGGTSNEAIRRAKRKMKRSKK